jgi:hypothetical protein
MIASALKHAVIYLAGSLVCVALIIGWGLLIFSLLAPFEGALGRAGSAVAFAVVVSLPFFLFAGFVEAARERVKGVERKEGKR